MYLCDEDESLLWAFELLDFSESGGEVFLVGDSICSQGDWPDSLPSCVSVKGLSTKGVGLGGEG